MRDAMTLRPRQFAALALAALLTLVCGGFQARAAEPELTPLAMPLI
jgi:hypothetical protein